MGETVLLVGAGLFLEAVELLDPPREPARPCPPFLADGRQIARLEPLAAPMKPGQHLDGLRQLAEIIQIRLDPRHPVVHGIEGPAGIHDRAAAWRPGRPGQAGKTLAAQEFRRTAGKTVLIQTVPETTHLLRPFIRFHHERVTLFPVSPHPQPKFPGHLLYDQIILQGVQKLVCLLDWMSHGRPPIHFGHCPRQT